MIDHFRKQKTNPADCRMLGYENTAALPGERYPDTARKISGRKRAEKALRDSESFLNDIIESIPDLLFVVDREFNIISANKKIEQAYSCAAPLVGNKCHHVFKENKEICPKCQCLMTMQTGMPGQTVVPVKIAGERIAGWLNKYFYPFVDSNTGDIKGAIVYVRDITEKLKMEQELARLERLSLIGEMAANIGHEIRNPLTTVRGFLQILSDRIECEGFISYFDLMINELDRANTIITDFLSLAKNNNVVLQKCDLVSIIRSLSPLIETDASNFNMHVITEMGNIPHLLLNEKEIRQLILNLTRNGLEAMDPGGTLTIKVFAEGEKVVLSVQDQGKGINPQQLDKIGTPFFTTKESGTGLGLAVCYSIAARHKAAINVQTGTDGTTFSIHFHSSRS